MIKKRKTAALFEVIAKEQGGQPVRLPGWFRRNLVAVAPVARPSPRLKQPPGLAGLKAVGQAATATAVEEDLEEQAAQSVPAAAPRPATVPVSSAAQALRRLQMSQASAVAAAAPKSATPAATAAPAFPGVQTTVIPGAVVKTPAASAAPAPAPAAASTASRAREETRPVAERLAAVVGGRLRVSLSYPICVAAALGLVVLLVGAFRLGRHQTSTAAPPAAAQSASPNPIAPAPVAGNGFDFDKSQILGEARYNAEKRYLMVEPSVASKADAVAICEWLYNNGFVPWAANDNDRIVVIALPKEPGGSADTFNKQAASLRELGKSRGWKLRDRYTFAQARVEPKK